MTPATRVAAIRGATLHCSCRGGHVYVYRAYGISMMLNISSEVEGVGAGVLIRAAEPIAGIDIMRRRRGLDDVYRLTRGPGRLRQAFAIDPSLDGTTYTRGNPLWLADDVLRPRRSAARCVSASRATPTGRGDILCAAIAG